MFIKLFCRPLFDCALVPVVHWVFFRSPFLASGLKRQMETNLLALSGVVTEMLINRTNARYSTALKYPCTHLPCRTDTLLAQAEKERKRKRERGWRFCYIKT